MRGHQPDLSLADLDWLGDEKSLRAQANELVSEYDKRSGSYRAGESSGSIWVTVDRRARLVDAQISRNWRDRLTADQVTEALLSLYTTAARSALLARASTSDPEPPPAEPVPSGLSEEEWLNRVHAVLAETEAELAAIRRHEPAEPPGDEEIRGRNGYLTLVLSSGGPVAINADPAVLAYADVDRLRQDVLDVFAQAGLGVLPVADEDVDGDFGFED